MKEIASSCRINLMVYDFEDNIILTVGGRVHREDNGQNKGMSKYTHPGVKTINLINKSYKDHKP